MLEDPRGKVAQATPPLPAHTCGRPRRELRVEVEGVLRPAHRGLEGRRGALHCTCPQVRSVESDLGTSRSIIFHPKTMVHDQAWQTHVLSSPFQVVGDWVAETFRKQSWLEIGIQTNCS